MVQTLITIRRARWTDAEEIAEVHDAAWRDAYRGLIPGRELERMISRRGPQWWMSAIERGSRLLVLDFNEAIVGSSLMGAIVCLHCLTRVRSSSFILSLNFRV